MLKIHCQFTVPTPYHLGHTLAGLKLGSRDPSMRMGAGNVQMCFSTPDGPVSVGAEQNTELHVACMGPGASWVEPRLAGLFGLLDDASTFRPRGKLQRLARQKPGAYLPRFPVIFPGLMQIVLRQLVSYQDAFRNWRAMVERYGLKAPGTFGLLLPPTVERLRKMSYADLMVCGVLPRQARLILRLAHCADRLEKAAMTGPAVLTRELRTIPGIGDWTISNLLGTVMGQADAVIIGDYSLPHTVIYFFTGAHRGDDQQMLQLLAPYAGHRFRVINMLMQSLIRAPRHGPRRASSRSRLLRRSGPTR